MTLKSALWATAAMLCGGCVGKSELAPPYPEPGPVDDSAFGARIARTMRAMAAGETVRVLFYGQSITREPWTDDVTARLRARYPKADIIAENRAIGGFSAELLVRTARTDIARFYPDLIVLHDLLRTPAELDALFAELARLSTAEVLVQTTHRRDEGWKGTRWDDKCVAEYTRAAAAHGYEVADIRAEWKQYLADNGLAPMALLRDHEGHLNAAGNALMADLIARHLRVHPSAHASGGVTVIEGAPASFDGHRVEVFVRGDAGSVLVDGAAPSTIPAAWVHGRMNEASAPDWPWEAPAAIRVDHEGALVDEEWTLTLRDVKDNATFAFTVRGSRTGDDGEGTSSADFVSTSRRVQIAARDWWTVPAREVKGVVIKDGDVIRWRAVPLHHDTIAAPEGAWVLVVSNLTDGPHTLTFERPAAVERIRVFSPQKR